MIRGNSRKSFYLHCVNGIYNFLHLVKIAAALLNCVHDIIFINKCHECFVFTFYYFDYLAHWSQIQFLEGHSSIPVRGTSRFPFKRVTLSWTRGPFFDLLKWRPLVDRPFQSRIHETTRPNPFK